MAPEKPNLCREIALLRQGYTRIAGIDEAGRGAWAGPVVAAACILPLNDPGLPALLELVCDSKLLSARQRDYCYQAITACALAWGVGIVSAQEIDRCGILPATRQAMQSAVQALTPAPELLLIDAVRLAQVDTPQFSEPKADRHYLSVASASIIAKVTRDRLMAALDKTHPGYGFARHKGYGTAAHLAALRERGICPEHRCSYKPVHMLLEDATQEV